MTQFKLDVVQDDDAFNELEGVWKELFVVTEDRNPFLSWEWCSTYWKYFKNHHSLFILIVRDSDEVISIFPFRKTRYSFFNIGYNAIEPLCYWSQGRSLTDYNGFLSSRNGLESFTFMMDYLNTLNDWDFLYLFDVPGDSLFKNIICEANIKNIKDIKEGVVCPYIDVNIPIEDIVNNMSKKDNHN